MAETVRLYKDGVIANVVLNRPEVFNAFDLEMAEALGRHLVALAFDEHIRGIVITGEGQAFCAGGDLKWVQSFPQGAPSAFHSLAGRFHFAVIEIKRMGKPVIAAINGVAAGAGFSLALACDFRLMSEDAVLRQAYTSAGLCIDGGGTFTLPRLVGLARALEIAALDEIISAETALAWGMITRMVPKGSAHDEALKLARDLAQRSLNSFAHSKKLLNASFETGFEAQLERERAGIVACADHLEGREGVRAFAEKRKPVFDSKMQG
jgi:2-(1,2-epoxy-1,2-dihydrophenyl)acetyl-CoA isomerase